MKSSPKPSVNAEVFALHPQLAADTLQVGRLALSRVLLMNDARYPWVILVPERPGLRELHDLCEADYQQLMTESRLLCQRLAQQFVAHKMNVAALGNVVPQLHLHHVVRYPEDPAWPAPIWGKGTAVAYSPRAAQARVGLLQSLLGDMLAHDH